MKPKTVIAPTTMDRLATPDEIRAALLPFSDPVEECTTEILNEISADLGGYENIPGTEFEIALMAEELTAAEDTWTN